MTERGSTSILTMNDFRRDDFDKGDSNRANHDQTLPDFGSNPHGITKESKWRTKTLFLMILIKANEHLFLSLALACTKEWKQTLHTKPSRFHYMRKLFELFSFLLLLFLFAVWNGLWWIYHEQWQLEEINSNHGKVLELKRIYKHLILLICCEYFGFITITMPLLMMMPWRNQQDPTSVPDRIIGNGMWRVHFWVKVFLMSSTGMANMQYMRNVRTKPNLVSTFAESSTWNERNHEPNCFVEQKTV